MILIENKITSYLCLKISKYSFSKRLCLVLIVCFMSLCGIFCSPSFLSATTTESSAAYISEVIKDSEIDYLPLLIEQEDDKHKVPNSYNEFHALYGAFKESNITYVGSVNGDKGKNISVSSLNTFQNLSFVYAEYFSNIEYNGHYKHQYYPLELMFHGYHSTNETVAFSFCYISQSQADELIESNYFGDGVIENYEQLLNRLIYIDFDGTEYPYMISNIYLEINYFYEGLKDAFGGFLIGNNRYPEGFGLQSCYFLRDYTFQNMFYMNRAKNIFGNSHYTVKIGNGLLDKTINTKRALAFFNQPNYIYIFDVFSIILLLSFVGVFSISFSVFLKQIYLKKRIFCLLLIIPFIVSFLLFFCLFLIFKNIIVFSFTSCLTFSILFFLCLAASIYFIKNAPKLL